MGAVLPAEAILRELAGLWAAQGREAQAQEGAGVLRACSMTLVVLAEESDDAGALGETIAALMPEHPSRAIVVRLTGPSAAALEHRVFAQCWKPFGQRRQICCEQIEIRASDGVLAGLPLVVLPLAAADLPVIVWCRSERMLRREEFGAIAAMAHKVIVDTGPLGRDGLKLVTGMLERGAGVADLSWTLLTRWREMLAEVFENRENVARLERLRTVSVDFAGYGETINWYMRAWILDSLAYAGVKAKLTAADGSHPVVLAGEDFRVELWRDETRMQVSVDGRTTCANLSPPSEYLLVREELGIGGRDRVFERTVASAVRLAYAND